MYRRFEEVISTRQRLRELSRQPSERARTKVINHVDDICRRFIAACPLVIVASRGLDGRLDLSPKGDPPGFIAILDAKTLVIPDRPGNHRLDTFENLMTHPEVGLFFIIPGNGDTLRMSGQGMVVRDGALNRRFAINGKLPNLLLVVTIDEVFFHCPKCMVRSGLWNPEHWPDRAEVPSLAEAIVAHSKTAESIAEVQTVIDEGTARHLY